MSYSLYFCTTCSLFMCVFVVNTAFILAGGLFLLCVKWMTSVAQYNNGRWMLWTIVGGGGCVMVAITWLGCIVAFPASLQFSSSLEHEYQNTGQNTSSKMECDKNSLTLWPCKVLHSNILVSLSFWSQQPQYDMSLKALDPLQYYKLLGDKGPVEDLNSFYCSYTKPSLVSDL